MKSKISAVLLVGLMVLSMFAVIAAPAGAATYTIAQVIAWSTSGGDAPPQYSWMPAIPSPGLNGHGTVGVYPGRDGQVTGQIRDTDNQAWMFPSNVTLVNATNATVDPVLYRMTVAGIFWPQCPDDGSCTYVIGSAATTSFEEFPEYEHYTFVGVNATFNSSAGDMMNANFAPGWDAPVSSDECYKTLVHYKVGTRWYTGQSNAYAVDADSSTTADVVIRPPPYYLCKSENDYSLEAGQNITITFTLFDVRSYLWRASTGGNICDDSANRSAGYTIAVWIDYWNNTMDAAGNFGYQGADPWNLGYDNLHAGGFYSTADGVFYNNTTTAATNSVGQATTTWTAPNCSFVGWVNITAYVVEDPLINITWYWDGTWNDATGSGVNRVWIEPCEAQWTCKVMDGQGNGVCTDDSWVTLYTMNDTGAWHITPLVTPGNPQHPDTSPYCGSFAFGHIPVNDTGTFGYVYANMTLGGMIIEGWSGNDGLGIQTTGINGEDVWVHALHAGRTATGCVVLDIPCADEIRLTASPSTILSGGYESVVTAQLYLNGSAYALENTEVDFTMNNTVFATMVTGTEAGGQSTKTVATDSQGQASVTIQSKDVSNVYVMVTADVDCNSVTNYTIIYISGWATLSGYVTDSNQVGVAGATVTLWPGAVWNTTAALWQHDADTSAIDTYVADNPQLSNDGSTSPLGTYTFEHIPFGYYYVEADATALTATSTDTRWFAIIDINRTGAHTANIAIPNFVAPTPVAPTTVPPTTPPTTVPPTTVPPTTVPPTTVPPTTTTTSPGFGALLALIGLGGVAYLVLRRRS
jgi:PGF-CTERM protein